jgi:hypothetical protein
MRSESMKTIISPHLFQRWNERIGIIYYDDLKKEVDNILNNGHKQHLGSKAYSINLDNVTLIVKEFNNERLIKTVY